MSEWREVRLGDLLAFGNGKRKPNTNGDIPIYGGNGILGFTNNSNYQDGTIIIGRVGAYCGSVYYETKPIWVSDNALSAKPKNNYNLKFLYYFLKQMDLNQYAGGSSHPLVTQTLLNSLEFYVCTDPDTQKAIAEVLSSLDDKIDLLYRQNKTLEQMAETLFRQWFVEEAREDWEEYKVSDIADHIKENIKPASNPLQTYNHYSLPAFDNGQNPIIEIGKEILSNKYKVIQQSILVSKLNPRVPRIWAIPSDVDENAICSTEFQVFKPKKESYYGFLVFLFKSDDAVGELEMAASGTSGSHQRVKPQDILNISFVTPSLTKIENYSRQVIPLIKKQQRNNEYIHTLQSLRNTLLPKLMSGEVRIAL